MAVPTRECPKGGKHEWKRLPTDPNTMRCKKCGAVAQVTGKRG